MFTLYPQSFHPGKRGNPHPRWPSESMRRSVVDLEVIIPAYNEAARIPHTLHQTIDFLAGQAWSSRIVVVDNGSVDETAAVVRRISREQRGIVPVSVVGCARRGKGAAVRRGLLSGTSKFTGFFDADLATPLETLSKTMAHLSRGAACHCLAPFARFHLCAAPAFGTPDGRHSLPGIDALQGQGDPGHPVRFQVLRTRRAHRGHGAVPEHGLRLRCRTPPATTEQRREDHRTPVAWTDGAESTFRPFHDGVASFASVIQLQKATS